MLWIWAAAAASAQEEGPSVDVAGYVETFASYNFNAPSNDVTNLRGFDSRAGSITLANAALDATGVTGDVTARVVLQAGHTPNSYFLAEPTLGAAGSAGETDARTWRNVQQAWASWQANDALEVEAGLFLSPIGPEGIAIKDDWNFSRSNLFFGLPFYHAGARASYGVSEPLTLVAAVYNGWNCIQDNNPGKSVSGQALLTKAPVTASVLYFGGVERPEGAPEGQPWRHLVDLWVQVDASDRVSFLLHGDVGLERNTFGDSGWAAGAAYARVMPAAGVYVAVRGDVFREWIASDGGGTASAVFWPASDDGVAQIASGTLTLDLRPAEGLSFRLEGRADGANADMFFAGDVPIESATGAAVPNASAQQTVTVGAVAWF